MHDRVGRWGLNAENGTAADSTWEANVSGELDLLKKAGAPVGVDKTWTAMVCRAFSVCFWSFIYAASV